MRQRFGCLALLVLSWSSPATASKLFFELGAGGGLYTMVGIPDTGLSGGGMLSFRLKHRPTPWYRVGLHLDGGVAVIGAPIGHLSAMCTMDFRITRFFFWELDAGLHLPFAPGFPPFPLPTVSTGPAFHIPIGKAKALVLRVSAGYSVGNIIDARFAFGIEF